MPDVAQTSRSAVSQAFQPADAGQFPAHQRFERAADRNVGETADWKVCATACPRARFRKAGHRFGFSRSSGTRFLFDAQPTVRTVGYYQLSLLDKRLPAVKAAKRILSSEFGIRN